MASSGPSLHALTHNWLGKVDIAVQTVLLVVALAAAGLRLWSRRLQRVALQGNDWLIVAAMVLMFGRYAVEIILVLLCEMGLHSILVERIEGPEAFVRFNKLTYAADLLWIVIIGLVQLSILHYYLQKFQARAIVRSIYILMALCSALCIACLLATAFLCTPPSKIWQVDLEGHCGDSIMLHVCSAVSEIILDGLILCISLPAIWHMQLSQSRKIALGGIYTLGIVIIVLSGLRVRTEFNQDPFYNAACESLLSCTVALLGIIVACFPLLSPAIQKIFRTSILCSTLDGDSAAGYWKSPASSGVELEGSGVPLTAVRRPPMARTMSELARGQITITSYWEIHSARNSARLDRDSVRRG